MFIFMDWETTGRNPQKPSKEETGIEPRTFWAQKVVFPLPASKVVAFYCNLSFSHEENKRTGPFSRQTHSSDGSGSFGVFTF